MIYSNFWGKIISYVVAKTVSHNADETGLKLTYNSGYQNLLAVNGNKNYRATHIKNEEPWQELHECKWKQLDSLNESV
jgi:hypothetical protein